MAKDIFLSPALKKMGGPALKKMGGPSLEKHGGILWLAGENFNKVLSSPWRKAPSPSSMVTTEPDQVEPLPKDFKPSYSKLNIAQLKKLLKINGVPFAKSDGKKYTEKICWQWNNQKKLKQKKWWSSGHWTKGTQAGDTCLTVNRSWTKFDVNKKKKEKKKKKRKKRKKRKKSKNLFCIQ